MTTVGSAPTATASSLNEADPFDFHLARRAPDSLVDFNRAGVLTAADIHVAVCIARLTTPAPDTAAPDATGPGPAPTETKAMATNGVVIAELPAHADPSVLLAAALAVRAPRLGHVCTDLATVAGTVALDSELPLDVAALPWPEPSQWIEHLSSSALVASGEDAETHGPLRLVGTRLYLDRYWREERHVAADLLARAEAPAAGVDPMVLGQGMARLFVTRDTGATAPEPVAGTTDAPASPDGAPPSPDHQRLAAAAAVLRRFSVVAGGPGTGKTTTVARILALLHEQAEAAGAPPPLVALAAPTGKAAARLEEAVHAEAAMLDVTDATRDRLLAMEASTLHRLLGWRPGNRSRFRHHRGNRLPHEVVVVDETSMVSLSLMARLVEAVRPTARLVLVGDPEQLASVEAGAVLGDIVGPAAAGLLMREPVRRVLAETTHQVVPASDPPAGAGPGMGDGIVVLRHVHRFGGGIAALAEAVRNGNPDTAMTLLQDGRDDLTWLPVDIAAPGAGMSTVRLSAVAAAQQVVEAARSGDAARALGALGAFRILCAHRHGPYGATTWMEAVERWLAAGVDGFTGAGAGPGPGAGEWYPGRPLLVTENDYGLRLYNGDTGVVVAEPSPAAGAPGRLSAVFERRGELVRFSPTRLAAVDTVYAMTVHKSQGSQFDTVAVLLPDPGSPLLTRELLYTGITRARRRLILAGTEEAIRAAVQRPIARASGLRHRLWGDTGTPSTSPVQSAAPLEPPTVR